MKKVTELSIVIIVLLLLTFVMCGCNEAQKQWGNGDPPAEWQDWFGNENTARLDFVQTQALDRQQSVIYGTDQKQPDGTVKHVMGLLERIAAFEKLNSEQHRKMGETDISLHTRLDALESENTEAMNDDAYDAELRRRGLRR